VSKYAERVARSLKGLQAVSTGTCPGCEECRAVLTGDDYYVFETDAEGTERWDYDASGNAMGWPTEEAAETAAREAWRLEDSGNYPDEGSFSRNGCGICNSSLGGTLYLWHWIDAKGVIQHAEDACTDCVVFLANGDEPDEPDESEDEPDESEDEPRTPNRKDSEL